MTDRDEKQLPPAASRRAVLLGAGALGAVGVLAACGTSTNTNTTNSGGGATTSNGGAAPTSDASGAGGAVKAADIPVGGGKIFADQKIVVTQPTAGTYKAFSAVCPHAGCLVTAVENGKIVCPCHGSEFKIADGSVAKGPATTALAGKTVTASGGGLAVA
jgi:nitrite reductase/ring-hydroxylating ferredoxin subunit